jgi:hypothetical protein
VGCWGTYTRQHAARILSPSLDSVHRGPALNPSNLLLNLECTSETVGRCHNRAIESEGLAISLGYACFIWELVDFMIKLFKGAKLGSHGRIK